MSLSSYVHKGVPLEVFVRIRSDPNPKQDIKVFENKVSLLDENNMGK